MKSLNKGLVLVVFGASVCLGEGYGMDKDTEIISGSLSSSPSGSPKKGEIVIRNGTNEIMSKINEACKFDIENCKNVKVLNSTSGLSRVLDNLKLDTLNVNYETIIPQLCNLRNVYENTATTLHYDYWEIDYPEEEKYFKEVSKKLDDIVSKLEGRIVE